MKACPSCQTTYPVTYTHCPRDGTALVDAGTWQEGTVVRGKYRILCKIGEGGMAAVYKALHTRFEELRALKVMNADLAGDHDFVKRFLHEAVLTRRIQHPNAVRVEDIDEAEDGRPFMVMEFLDGRGLKETIEAEAPMAPARVCRVARQIAGALSAAHGMGVVHRDVKPANIVLIREATTGGGELAKVLDFGIAKARETRLDDSTHGPGLTRTGNVIGTPTYMSPEQARGMKGSDLDGRSDLYSLGIVMYQMLAGGLPFKADTSMQWILAHLQTPPTPFAELRKDLQIPPALAVVVMRCLEKDPNRRPDTAAALIEELAQAEQTIAPLAARAAFLPGAEWRQPRADGAGGSLEPKTARSDQEQPETPAKRRWLAWTAGALTVLALAGAFGYWSVRHALGTPPMTGSSPAAPGHDSSIKAPDEGHALDKAAPNAEPEINPKPTPVADQRGAGSGTANAAGNPASGANPATLKPLVARPPGFTAAVQRAKDDESQGRFEDALRDYQLAAALDPTDASVRRHIALLQDRISREKDLIR